MRKKNRLKGLLAMSLAVAQMVGLLSVGGALPALAEPNEVVIYDMMVNHLDDPIGIDDGAPVFSWKLQSDQTGQKQTAYQLVMATDAALNDIVWDSGKVESNDTTDISYDGEALADCTRYYWQITVWDMNGDAHMSDVHFFETAFISGSLEDGAAWIEVDETVAVGNVAHTVDYTIETDVVSITAAFNLLFGGGYKVNNDYFMWKIVDKGTYYQILPCYYTNNKWIAHTQSADITAIPYADMKDGFHLTVRVNDYAVHTYVDNTLVSVVPCAELGYTPSLGFVGVREASSEGVVLDALTVTDYLNNEDGVVLASFDFATKPSAMTNVNSIVENGVLTAVSDSSNGNWYGEDTFVSGLAAASKRTRDFSVSMDVISIKSAMGLLIGAGSRVNGDYFKWTLEDKTTYYQLTPVCWVDNKWAVVGSTVKLSTNLYAQMEDGFHLEVRVNDDRIVTYVDGTAVATYTCTELGYTPSLGLVGFREATNEGVVIDNLTVVDYLHSANGTVLASLDYADEADGTLHAVSDPDVNSNWYGEIAQLTGLASATERTVDYTIDMDVISVKTAIGLLFGAGNRVDGDCFMWKLEDKSTYYQLTPVCFVNNKWTTVGSTTVLPAAMYTDMQDGFRLKVHIDDARVVTYVDGTAVATYTCASLGYTPSLGFVGFRQATDEGVVIDNLTVTDYLQQQSGTVLAKLDYANEADGTLHAVSDPEVNNNWYGEVTQVSGLTSSVEKPIVPIVKNVHYTVEADMACTELAASLCFNAKNTANFLMWQFGITETGVELRRNQWCGGAHTALGAVDISEFVTAEQLKAGAFVKIEVMDTAILTYVDGKLVNIFDTEKLAIDLFPGKCGVRVATDEAFVLDSYKSVNLYDNKVLFDVDFEMVNPMYRGTLKDGKLYLDYNDKDNGMTFVHTGSSTFRKQFTAEKEIASARLYITSYGVFTPYLNGERVGNKNAAGEMVYDELAPGWTDQNERTCYYTYDVTDMVNDGDNTLTVNVNNGWTGISLYYSDEPKTPNKLLAKMVFTYTDGTTAVIGTDDTWDTAVVGPVMAGDIYYGEYYDATQDVSYRLNGFDTSAWNKAKEVTFATTLASRIGGQIYVRKDLERKPQSVTVYDGITDAIDGTQYGKINVVATYGDESFALKAGQTAVVNLGQNASGWENITLSGAAGTHMVIRHAEMLNDNMGLISRGNDGPEGSVYTANLRKSPAKTVYVMKEGEQTYRPTVTYYGFQYMEITATADITISKIRGEVATSVFETDGAFESSDTLLNQLYSNTVWGQYSNHFGQATDCSQRDERLGYPGDFMVFSQAAIYNADIKAFVYNFMDTLVEGQAPNGAFGMVMPKKYSSDDRYIGIAGSADGGILIPYYYWRQYGDIQFLERYYDAMAAYADYLAAAGPERPNQQYGDWLSYEDYIVNYISYAYTVWDAQAMQELAAALGKTEDVTKWAAMEETHKGYFREKFLDENGDLTVTTQSAYLFALKLGLYADDAAYERGQQALVTKIKQNGNKLSTGFQGTFILMDTLVQIGETDLAYELLFQDENPSWLFEVKQGATTAWERWNSYSKEDGFGPVSMNSFNHYAFGSVGAYLYKTVLGITPAEVGYTKVNLAPVTTEKLTYAKGSYDSVNGLIRSAWKLDTNDRYTYDFTVPMNTTATVKLAKQAYASNYSVNGVAAADLTMENDGAAFVKEEDGYVYFEVTSGTFTFTCEAIPLLSAEKSAENGAFSFSVAGLSEYNGGYTANSNKGWYTFPEEDTEVVDAVTNAFHMYYNRENVYMQRTDVTATDLDDADTYCGSTSGASRWILLYDNYLQRSTSKTSGEKMRKIDSLVPLGSDGEEIVLTNFETTFDVRFESDTLGAALLGFRQQIPGKFVDGLWTLNKEQAFVAIGRGGINIAGGNDIVSGNGTVGDMYNNWQTAAFDELLPQEVSVKVKVVGTTCEVWIYNVNTTEQLKYYNVEIPYEKAGTIAYGVSTVGHDIGDFKLTKLDENGEVADIFTKDATNVSHLPYSHGNITVADAKQTENGYQYTVTVQPDAGYELRAGSLIVTDASGNAYVPTRVGYRNGGDASQYVFETTGGGTVAAEFYQPTKEDPNIGWVGTSVHTEDSGLRFIHRLNIDADGYMTMDGEKVKIKEYGLLLATAPILSNPEDLDIETADESMHVHQYAWPETDKYYDLCDDHVDIAIHVKNIAKYNGQNTDIITRVYLILESGEVIYGDVAVSTYNEAAGVQ